MNILGLISQLIGIKTLRLTESFVVCASLVRAHGKRRLKKSCFNPNVKRSLIKLDFFFLA